MKKLLSVATLGILLTGGIVSCKKSVSNETDASALSSDEKALVASAGFNSNWAEKNADGNYLIEGDILLTPAQLQEMSGATPTHNFIVADEEHYRTYNLV